MMSLQQNKGSRQFREVREFYARFLATSARSSDPRFYQAFERVPREGFLPSGPWKIFVGNVDRNAYVETPSADPIHLYQNVLVALDEDEGINNGQPSLHAAWMGAVLPRAGETVVHIGAGRGYYAAILSKLVSPGGRVQAFEINGKLAAAAQEHLTSYSNVTMVKADAVTADLPDADIIYVNAGVAAPPLGWLSALRLGGRMVFPWRPSETMGWAILVTRQPRGFQVKRLAPSWFIPCIGAADIETVGPVPDPDAVRRTRSIRLVAETKPDETATAVYPDIWFSEEEIAASSILGR